ncbi:HTH-type transcriptional regulator DmlR [Cupriavidus pampae]|uniref:HTH-type transcriptional regulator DmlR n=2 Tax=Cupriavidus pampae TaxID=659251 RepID=A0ABM8WB94_9BURK|nr:HTH-type transcriptional regulator DmlR [Cupriavidus pampae]
MSFDNRKIDILAEGFDAALRTGEIEDDSLASRDLGSFRLYLVASPAYLERRGRPAHPRDLSGHDCIHYRMPHSGQIQTWPLTQDEGDTPPVLPTRLICNNDAARLQFALDGLGLTCMSEFSVRDHLNSGRLEPVLEPYLRYRYTFRLVWPIQATISPTLRTFIDFVNTWFASAQNPDSASGPAIDNR